MKIHPEMDVDELASLGCDLPASGFTHTPVAVLEWADRAVADARNALRGESISARIWPYRHGAGNYLACDFWCDDVCSGTHKTYFSITFVVDAEPNFRDACEPQTADMADALHMAGIVLIALRANVTLGRRGNEVNEAVLARPLAGGETNGAMRVAGSPPSMPT
jgi:hypothetical protein